MLQHRLYVLYRGRALSLSLSVGLLSLSLSALCVATLVVAPKLGQVMAHVIYEVYAHKKAHTIMDRYIDEAYLYR